MHENIEYYTLKNQLLEEVHKINEAIYNNQLKIKEIEAYFKSKPSIQILKKCINPKCNGFLNSNYVCELCETCVCSKCFKEKKVGTTHECNESDIKTIELLHGFKKLSKLRRVHIQDRWL